MRQAVCKHSEPALPLVVIIVNYRTPELVIGCLDSLADERRTSNIKFEVTVVDNGSEDGSATRLREVITKNGWQWCRVIANGANLGFAGGNNVGIRNSPEAQHVLLLNSDTLIHRGCLAYCLKYMDQTPSVGILTCRLMQPDGAVQRQARRFPTPVRETVSSLGLPWRWPGWFGWASSEDEGWDRMREARDVEWVGGAFMWLRGAMLKQVGLLDESFFFYGEDVELCHRAKRHGWRRRYDPAVAITHFGGGSGAGQSIEHKPEYWQARYLIQRRCYGRWAEAVVRTVDKLTASARSIRGAYRTRPLAHR
jgi:GT2 family glycosyltransferase